MDEESNMIVAVSGGFDPLHVGHIDHMLSAKRLQTNVNLYVILNSDEFLIKKKGYVFMPFKEREIILKNLWFVYDVMECMDKDHTVAKTLEWLKPDIFAKGGDRTMNNIPQEEIDICRKLNIQLLTGIGGDKTHSSSQMVERFKK